MNKYSIALSLAILCSCSSTAISKEVIQLDSKVITADSPKIIETAIEKVPYDIWERIRVDLTLTIPEDQIAATSSYRERLYKNQSAVNRISKRLGPNRTKEALIAIEKEEWSNACKAMLDYYDRCYDYELKKTRELNSVDLSGLTLKLSLKKILKENLYTL